MEEICAHSSLPELYLPLRRSKYDILSHGSLVTYFSDAVCGSDWKYFHIREAYYCDVSEYICTFGINRNTY